MWVSPEMCWSSTKNQKTNKTKTNPKKPKKPPKQKTTKKPLVVQEIELLKSLLVSKLGCSNYKLRDTFSIIFKVVEFNSLNDQFSFVSVLMCLSFSEASRPLQSRPNGRPFSHPFPNSA